MTQQHSSESEDVGYGMLAFLLVGTLVSFGIYWYFVSRIEPTAARGPFGDMFGGFNALFTAFAFAGLIYSSYLQRRELALQREELSATREELRGQKEQLAGQREVAQLQLFESTFFQLLALHHQIVEAVRFGSAENSPTGRHAFASFRMAFSNQLTFNKPESRDELSGIRASYDAMYKPHQHSFGHYFRHLYHIIRFIDRSKVADKAFYIGIVRAQLSAYEQVMLFYNCLSDQGSDKFKPLVEKYALLNNLDLELLLEERHSHYFEPGAYVRTNSAPAV